MENNENVTPEEEVEEMDPMDLVRIEDGKIALCRYQATTIHKVNGRELCNEFTTEEACQTWFKRIGKDGEGQITQLDVSEIAWLEGEPAVNLQAAVAMFEMGPEAYFQQKAETKAKTRDQIRADLDYLAVMTGVNLV